MGSLAYNDYPLYDHEDQRCMSEAEIAAIKHEVPISVIPGINLKLTDIFLHVTP